MEKSPSREAKSHSTSQLYIPDIQYSVQKNPQSSLRPV
jgi:hypothetical protein